MHELPATIIMAKQLALMLLAVLAGAVVAVPAASVVHAAKPSISSVIPSTGSLAGGTRCAARHAKQIERSTFTRRPALGARGKVPACSSARSPAHPHAIIIMCRCRLSISGSGFARDRYSGSNDVLVGTYACSVINHLTTDTLVGGQVRRMLLALRPHIITVSLYK